MPVFCGIHVHFNHRCGCQKPTQVESKATWKPSRPHREDGPFGLPLELPQERPEELQEERPCPPSRSALRHLNANRVPRDQRPSDLRRSRSVGPSFAERVKKLCPDRYPGIVSPTPRKPSRISYPIKDENTEPGSVFARNHFLKTPAKTDAAREVYPRYGPDSRPPIALDRWEAKYSTSHNLSYHNQTQEHPRQRIKEPNPKHSKTRNESSGPSQTTLLLNKPLPQTPQVKLTQVTIGWQGPTGPEDEPIYFVPVSGYDPDSFRSRAGSLASLNMV